MVKQKFDDGHLGRRIASLRKQLGMTQVQLAERVGMSQSAIASIERGKRRDLKLSTCDRLAKALCCEALMTFEFESLDANSILQRRSYELAEKMVKSIAGSAAIEKQPPSEEVVRMHIAATQKEILEKHRSMLWESL